MQLAYKAVSRGGKQQKGIIEAKDIQDAVLSLRNRGFLPITIVEHKATSLQTYFPFFKPYNAADVVFITRQLSSMLKAGLTLLQALSVLSEQMQNESIKDVLGEIIRDIEEGKSFANSIARYPDMFSDVYVSLVRTGESSGLLDTVLSRLADNLEKQQKLASTIKGALMYPMIVIIGMVAVVIVMMIFVIPQLKTLYENLNVELPLPTKIVMAASSFTINFWPILIFIPFALIIGYNRWYKTDVGKLTIDSFWLKVPIVGRLIKDTILTEISRTLGLLIGSGALVVESLRKTSEVSGNILYKNVLRDVADKVEKGITIGDSLSNSPLFPPIFIEMTKIGEQTGKLDESLQRLSEYFEQEADTSVRGLTAALEPIIMVILGLGVGFLIISVITPIYNLASAIK